MRLLVITQKVDKDDPILGFFHRWLFEFSKHVKKLTVVCLEEGVHDLPDDVRVLSLGKEEGAGRFGYLSRFFGLIIRERNAYDAVFVHMNPIYVVLGGIFWKLWKKKIALWYTHKSVTTTLRLAEKMADIIFSASERSFRLESEKVRFVGHGIDTELFRPASHRNEIDQCRILTVGRISPVKDYATLLQAAEILAADTDLDFKLTIVGGPVTDVDTAYLQKLKEGITTSGLEQHVIFAGSISQEEVVSYYQAADVFVNTSRTGSLDKAVLEAMATHVYPLTSNEAFRDVFGDRWREHMFVPGDAKSLAQKLERIATQTPSEEVMHLLRTMVEEDHSVSALIPRLLSYFAQL